MTQTTYATHEQITGVEGGVRDYIRALGAMRGVNDIGVLSDLELTYRARINGHLLGTGLALVGDVIVGPRDPAATEIRAQIALEQRTGEASAPAAAIALAQPTDTELTLALTRQSPSLTLLPEARPWM